MEISSHILQLTGKAELPYEINMSSKYHISLEGGVNSISEIDNEDGTANKIYKFKSIKVELLDETGKVTKLKDTRKNSEKLRSRIRFMWQDKNIETPPDKYYDKVMAIFIKNLEEIIEHYDRNN